MSPFLLTPIEVADVLRTSRKAIYTMIERAQLPGSGRTGMARSRPIQEPAGHSELGVTRHYMRLSPALDAAIQLLDGRGNIVATPAGLSREVGTS